MLAKVKRCNLIATGAVALLNQMLGKTKSENTRTGLKGDIRERDFQEIFKRESMGRGPKASTAASSRKARDQYDRIRVRDGESQGDVGTAVGHERKFGFILSKIEIHSRDLS